MIQPLRHSKLHWRKFLKNYFCISSLSPIYSEWRHSHIDTSFPAAATLSSKQYVNTIRSHCCKTWFSSRLRVSGDFHSCLTRTKYRLRLCAKMNRRFTAVVRLKLNWLFSFMAHSFTTCWIEVVSVSVVLLSGIVIAIEWEWLLTYVALCCVFRFNCRSKSSKTCIGHTCIFTQACEIRSRTLQ